MHFRSFTFTFIHLADAFIQSDLLIYMSEVTRLWSNLGLSVLLKDTLVSHSGFEPGSFTPKACVLSTENYKLHRRCNFHSQHIHTA